MLSKKRALEAHLPVHIMLSGMVKNAQSHELRSPPPSPCCCIPAHSALSSHKAWSASRFAYHSLKRKYYAKLKSVEHKGIWPWPQPAVPLTNN